MKSPDDRSSSGLVQNLLLLAGVCLAMFAVAELAIRWLSPAAVVGPPFTEHDPVYGKRLKPDHSARRTTPEFSFVLRTNSLGFRGPEPDGPIEDAVLFLGDSYTMGYGVEDDESFPARIERMLAESGRPDVPVVNAGLGNSGNGWWLPFLERRAPEFSPRAVVLQVTGNDFGDNRAEKMFVLDDTGRLQSRPVPPPGWERRAQAVIEAVPGLGYSHLVGTLRVLAAGRGATGAEEDEDAAEDEDAGNGSAPGETAATETAAAESAEEHALTRAILAEALDRCRASGWPVVGLLVGVEEDRREAVVQVFDAWGVPWVGVPSKEEAPDLFFQVDDHLNADGHRVAAERVWGTLEILLESAPAEPGGGR